MIKKKVTYVNRYKRKTNNEIISIKPYYRNVPNPAKSKARKKWVVKINADLKGIHNLLEFYFEDLLLAISKDGQLIFPNNIKRV